MIIAVGSTNAAKVLAVKEVLQASSNFSKVEILQFAVDSGVSHQPVSLQETILGAKNRAKNAFCQCECMYSFGIESGLMVASETATGYLHVSVCCIYDGKGYSTGLSTGFEIPPPLLERILKKNMALGEACLHSGISRNAKLGTEEGLIGVLTKGKIDRKEYSKQCVMTALIQLENRAWYSPIKASSPVIKAVIFDCDGTLVDSEQDHFQAWCAALSKQGFLLEKGFYMNHFSGVGDAEIAKMAVKILGYDCYKELLDNKNGFFKELQVLGISSIPATVEFVTRLFEQKEKYKLKLAVASGARKEEIIRNLQSLHIDHYFDVILSGRDDLSEYQDKEGTNKPKPYVYLKTAKMLGLTPEECIAIEDSRTGVAAARDAGCFTVAIPNQYTQQHDLSRAHLQIESLAGLSMSDFFAMIRSFEENFL